MLVQLLWLQRDKCWATNVTNVLPFNTFEKPFCSASQALKVPKPTKSPYKYTYAPNKIHPNSHENEVDDQLNHPLLWIQLTHLVSSSSSYFLCTFYSLSLSLSLSLLCVHISFVPSYLPPAKTTIATLPRVHLHIRWITIAMATVPLCELNREEWIEWLNQKETSARRKQEETHKKGAFIYLFHAAYCMLYSLFSQASNALFVPTCLVWRFTIEGQTCWTRWELSESLNAFITCL